MLRVKNALHKENHILLTPWRISSMGMGDPDKKPFNRKCMHKEPSPDVMNFHKKSEG